MTLPEGTIQRDSSGMSVVAIRGRAFYDRALARWVPAGRSDVSPDGRQYVYNTFDENGVPTSLHLVDAVTLTDRVLLSGQWDALDFGPDGIYLAKAEPLTGGYAGVGGYRQLGVYRVGLAGGTPAKLSDLSLAYFSLGAGSGWGLAGGQGDLPPTRVVRLDLNTGAAQTWMQVERPAWLSNLALDQRGYPLVVRNMAESYDLTTVAERKAPVVLLHSDVGKPWPQGPFAVDAYGTWLSTFSSKEPFSASPWFVSPRGAVFELPSVAPRSVEVAGGCQ